MYNIPPKAKVEMGPFLKSLIQQTGGVSNSGPLGIRQVVYSLHGGSIYSHEQTEQNQVCHFKICNLSPLWKALKFQIIFEATKAVVVQCVLWRWYNFS